MELAANSEDTLCPNCAVMKLDNALAESEAEPHAILLAGALGVNWEEAREEVAELRRRDAAARVANDDLQRRLAMPHINRSVGQHGAVFKRQR